MTDYPDGPPERFKQLLSLWNNAFAMPEWPEIKASWLRSEANRDREHAKRLAAKLNDTAVAKRK